MIRKFTTDSGSVYLIDFEQKMWMRKRGRLAATTRSDSGIFHTIQITPDGIVLHCPPIEDNAFERIVESTPLTCEVIGETW